jgi:DNA-binding transcriptional ArsR family regulator
MQIMQASLSTVPSDAALVFERAADLFGLLSSSMRLRIVSELCRGELSVGQLRDRVDTTQPNLSQHLAVLYRAGILARRREGSQVHYRVAHVGVAAICRTVCIDFAMQDGPG